MSHQECADVPTVSVIRFHRVTLVYLGAWHGIGREGFFNVPYLKSLRELCVTVRVTVTGRPPSALKRIGLAGPAEPIGFRPGV